MSNSLKERNVGAEKSSKAKEREDYSLSAYPRDSMYSSPMNAEGETDKNGEFLCLSYVVHFRTEMDVSVEASGPRYRITMGGHVLFEGEMTEHIVEVIEKSWPLAAKKIKRWTGKTEEESAE